MKAHVLLRVACVAFLPFAANAHGATLIFAERGKAAEYSIAIPAKASPAQKYAAEELRDFTEKTTGVKLPIVEVAPGAALPEQAVVLETKAGTKEAHALDGFRLKVEGRRLRIIGENDRGTLYGVYEVLERFADCRWYASWHACTPRRARIEVPANLDETQTPAFAMREPYWYDVIQNPAFAARLRVNSRSWRRLGEKYGGDPYRFGGGLGSCHTFNTLLSPKEYFATHPEYFSLVRGRRLSDRTQLCLTNPDVLRIVTSNVLSRIRKDPGAKFYGVSQNDWYNFCECPSCKAVDKEEGSHAGTMIRFVNAIAEAVEKEFPEAIIETLAYQYTRKAPKKTKLRHNVVPCLCTIECDFAQPIDKSPFSENIAFCKDIADWSRLTDFLYIWDYTTDFANYTMPWPNVYALQGNVQFFRRNKVKALFEQGAYQGRHADFAELKAWLLAKWMWNPDLPMKELLDDFFAGYYGKGAPFVRDYFEAVHKLQGFCSSFPNKPLLIFDSVDSSVLPDAFLDFADGCWRQAADAVKDDPATSYNVRMSKFSFDYLRLERSHKLLNLATTPSLTLSPEQQRRLAQSLLDRMDEAKDIRLAERDRASLVREWKRIAAGQSAPKRAATSGELEELHLPIQNRRIWGDYVDDPQAGDGKALKLFNTHYQWSTQLPMSKIAFEPGKKYRLSVRVRVDKARDGEAFWAGVYSKGAKRSRGGVQPRTKDVGDGYAWYTVATWVPAPDEIFWIAPGRFNEDGKSAINGVYVDKIKLELVDTPDAGKVVFRDDFEGANESAWRADSKRFSYVAGEGVNGSKALMWEGAQPVDKWETYGYTFPVECGRDYTYSVKARSAEDIVGRVYVRIACVMADGKRRAFTLNGMPIVNNGWKRGRKNWTVISGCTPPMPPGASKGVVEFAVMGRTTGKMFFDDISINAGGKTVIRYLQSSAYRDEAVDGTVKFAAYYGVDPVAHPLASRQAFFAYKGKDGQVRRVKAQELDEMFFTVTIPVADMAEGRHEVKAILADANGKELDSTTLPFSRVAALPSRRVRFDAHQRLIVDGKPFFPLGCYGCGKDDEKTDLYASFAFNCTLVGDPDAAERAKKHGIKVIWSAGSTTGPVSRALARWKGDPNVIAWYTADEIPIGFAKRQAQLKLMLHAADPDRPAFTVLDKPLDSRDLLASFDVIGTDPYPICNPRPIDTCTGYPLKTREMTFGMRPIWQVPQAFDWHWHRRNFRRGMAEHRFPTREEFMSMSWQPIAVGVKGLIWYDFNWFVKDLPKDEYETTLAYIRQTVGDIARYSDVFLSVEPVEQPTTSAKGVTTRSWRVGEKRYLLVVNTQASPVQAEVSPGGAEVKAVQAEIGNAPSVSAGKQVFDLPALGFSFVSF